MKNEKLINAKRKVIFGIITIIASIAILLLSKENFVGISGAIVGAALAIDGYRIFKKRNL